MSKQNNQDILKDTVCNEAFTEVLEELRFKFQDKNSYISRLVDDFYRTLFLKEWGSAQAGIKQKLDKNNLIKTFNKNKHLFLRALENNREFRDELYKRSYSKLKILKEGQEWGEFFYKEIYQNELYINEIFVRLAEEEKNTEITSLKQLKEITGIKELIYYWDEKEEKDIKIPTKEERKEKAQKGLETAFIQAMHYRYLDLLESLLKQGALYKDIVNINPKDFNLPRHWFIYEDEKEPTNKEKVILWAIFLKYDLGEVEFRRPPLRDIANEIKAPYSVVLEAYKLLKV